MVHRDLKPLNLMLTDAHKVKILDFGLARVAQEHKDDRALTRLNAFMGTPEYVAPEQALDARSAGIQADVYSLGCTLYCLLAGRPPFSEATIAKTVEAKLHREPPPLPTLRREVPEPLWEVVARMLAKKPADRFATPAEVARALKPFVDGATTGSARSSPAAGEAKPAAGPVPTGAEYSTAIQNPQVCFSDPDLRQGRAAAGPMGGLPLLFAGNFAVVYKVQGPSGVWAVKCFTRKVDNLTLRYKEIAAHLRNTSGGSWWTLSFSRRGSRSPGRGIQW